MIISQINAGLGNQMLQYAAGYCLAKDLNSTHKLDLTYYSSIPANHTKRKFELNFFNISSSSATEIETLKLKGKKYSPLWLLNIINYIFFSKYWIDYPLQKYFGAKDLYLNGYFFSEKFFINYREQILKEFTLESKYRTREYIEIEDRINKDKDSVSMHIRRGDFITNKFAAKHHGILSQDYYKKALKTISEFHNRTFIYVFSDDIYWVQNNFKFLPKSTYFVSKHKFNSAQEMTLMSLCRNNIIANSSFSWWGAWLNKNNEKKVIAPKKYYQDILTITKDIVPKSWIRV